MLMGQFILTLSVVTWAKRIQYNQINPTDYMSALQYVIMKKVSDIVNSL